MKSIKLLLFPILIFAFNSNFAPNLNKYTQTIKCDKVLYKTDFDICYSYKYKHPLAVTYILRGDLVQRKLSRKHLTFRPDYNLPAKCRSYSKDYSRTGYDRGHLAPNAAFDYNRSIQKQTFLMSNIAPQKPQLNRRLWAKIEKFTRILAIKNRKIEVTTGVCGNKGYIKNDVGIPKYWFKIIYIPKTKKTIAFLVPNSNAAGKRKAKEFLVGVKEIKKKCGF